MLAANPMMVSKNIECLVIPLICRDPLVLTSNFNLLNIQIGFENIFLFSTNLEANMEVKL